jgi:hypothetical protein
LPQLALATNPPGEVGALQAVYDFCGKVDPAKRREFERNADALLTGLTPAQVAALRKSTEYKRGYHMLQGILPDLKNSDAVVACGAISGGHPQPREHGSEDHDHDHHRK